MCACDCKRILVLMSTCFSWGRFSKRVEFHCVSKFTCCITHAVQLCDASHKKIEGLRDPPSLSNLVVQVELLA